MKYMLLIYVDEQALERGRAGGMLRESAQLAQELQTNGQYLAASPLQPDVHGDQRPGARRQARS